MSNVMTIELEASQDAERMRRLFALWLVQTQEYSIAAAGKVADVPLEEWLKWVSSQGVAVLDYGDDWNPQSEMKLFEDTHS